MSSQAASATMEYKPAEPMATRPGGAGDLANEQQVEVEDGKPPRTFLGMRGGGIILDLCACFICCECMEGCCNAIDDCCCC